MNLWFGKHASSGWIETAATIRRYRNVHQMRIVQAQAVHQLDVGLFVRYLQSRGVTLFLSDSAYRHVVFINALTRYGETLMMLIFIFGPFQIDLLINLSYKIRGYTKKLKYE